MHNTWISWCWCFPFNSFNMHGCFPTLSACSSSECPPLFQHAWKIEIVSRFPLKLNAPNTPHYKTSARQAHFLPYCRAEIVIHNILLVISKANFLIQSRLSRVLFTSFSRIISPIISVVYDLLMCVCVCVFSCGEQRCLWAIARQKKQRTISGSSKSLAYNGCLFEAPYHHEFAFILSNWFLVVIS